MLAKRVLKRIAKAMKIILLCLFLSHSWLPHSPRTYQSLISKCLSLSLHRDPRTSDQVEIFLKRELRSLGDVDVTDEDPDYILSIVPLKNQNQAGVVTGYTISVLLTSPVATNVLHYIVDADSLTNAQRFCSGLVRVEDHEVVVCPPGELRKTCEGLIATIDTQNFEPTRKVNESARKALSKYGTRADPVSNSGTNQSSPHP